MARLTDHDVRDAEHALRLELSLLLGRYSRRVLEQGKALIQTEVEEASKGEEAIDGTAIGREAFRRAASAYFILDVPANLEAIEGHSDRADGFA
jgi:hypothetical protein